MESKKRDNAWNRAFTKEEQDQLGITEFIELLIRHELNKPDEFEEPDQDYIKYLKKIPARKK